MKDSYSHTQLMAIINMVVSGNHPGGTIDDRIYTLDEIVERTGWAKSTLEEELRAGTYDYTGKGRSVGMTPTQLAQAIARFERKRKDAAPAIRRDDVEVDELAQVRAASRSAQNRSRPRPRQKAAS